MRQKIIEQIESATTEPPPEAGSTPPDEMADDPEFVEMVKRQKLQLEEMDKRHVLEQNQLLEKLRGASDDLLIF
jgi:hypothetical protein